MKLTKEAVLDIVLREALMYGARWRYSWNEFDGRSLRSQLGSLAAWARNPKSDDFREGTECYRIVMLENGDPNEDVAAEIARVEKCAELGQST